MEYRKTHLINEHGDRRVVDTRIFWEGQLKLEMAKVTSLKWTRISLWENLLICQRKKLTIFLDWMLLPIQREAILQQVTIVKKYVKDMDNIANVLEKMTVDEQLEFIKMNNLVSQLDDLESNRESEMTDEQWLEYLIRQDKGVMTMKEFERLGTKAIQELFAEQYEQK